MPHKVCRLLTSPVLLCKLTLKIRGRRRQVKRRFKSELAIFQSSSSLFHFACKLCRMYVTSLGVEFLRALSKLRKRKKISSLLVLGAWCYTRRFATTIFTIVSATQGSNVGTTLQPFETTSQQCFNAVRVALKIVPRKITFTSSIKHEIRLFSRGSLRRTAKNCTKRCDTRAILLFCFSNLLLLWRSPCRRLILRSPLLLWHVAIIHHPA